MIIGAQKSGTTTLYKLLNSHPSLEGGEKKEPAFFSKSTNWKAELDDYESLFIRNDDKLKFEASTTYTIFPHYNLEIWNDIYTYNPQMKFIYIIREPVARIISSYMHHYERGYTDLPLHEAMFQFPRLLDFTRYATQITPYIERFGRENVHICFFEDLVSNPGKLLDELAKFLGVAPGQFRKIERVHANNSLDNVMLHHRFKNPALPQRFVRRFLPWIWRLWTDNSKRTFTEKPVPSDVQRRAIIRILLAEIKEIERLTGRNLGSWMSGLADTKPAKAI